MNAPTYTVEITDVGGVRVILRCETLIDAIKLIKRDHIGCAYRILVNNKKESLYAGDR